MNVLDVVPLFIQYSVYTWVVILSHVLNEIARTPLANSSRGERIVRKLQNTGFSLLV